MSESAWGMGIIVRWILILAVIILTIWALYNFLLRPVVETFGGDAVIPAIPILFATKGFKTDSAYTC